MIKEYWEHQHIIPTTGGLYRGRGGSTSIHRVTHGDHFAENFQYYGEFSGVDVAEKGVIPRGCISGDWL